MRYRRFFLKALFMTIAGVFLATAADARPPTSVKSTTIREENPKGLKSALVLPYAFSTDSMGFTAGVGGLVKGYGQEQLVLGATAFGSSDEAVGLFLGMWDYSPSWANRFFFSAEGMVGHYPKQRVIALNFGTGDTPTWEEDTTANGYIEISHRPPFYEGAILGGFYRMRAIPSTGSTIARSFTTPRSIATP